MKDTLYSYVARTDYDRNVTVKGNTFRCYSAKKMQELYPEGGYKTVGESVSGSGKGLGTKKPKNPAKAGETKAGQLAVGSIKYNTAKTGTHASWLFKPCGYVRVGEDAFVVLLQSRLAMIPWILFGVVFVSLLLVINFRDVWFDNGTDPGIIEPSYEDTDPDPHQEDWDDPNDKVATLTDYAQVKMPNGVVQFLYDLSSAFKDGPVRASLAIVVDDVGYVLTNKQTEIINGKIPDTVLDWENVRMELLPGTYVGSLLIVQTDPETGLENETYLSVPIVIRKVNEGSISLTYSDQTYLNLSTGIITMDYRHSGNATHNCILQLVLDDGDTPYVIATSGVITPGHRISQMTLDPAFTSRLRNGVYTGRLRVNYYSDESEQFNFNTDIAVTITVRKN